MADEKPEERRFLIRMERVFGTLALLLSVAATLLWRSSDPYEAPHGGFLLLISGPFWAIWGTALIGASGFARVGGRWIWAHHAMIIIAGIISFNAAILMELTGVFAYLAAPNIVPDSGVARSPDGSRVAWVRRTADRMVETTLGPVDATELWIADPDGSNSRRLVGSAASDTVERALARFSGPAFSPDGRRIYFLSGAWATSDAVHAVDVKTGREWFVADGNSLEVVPRGEYAGCLLVEQHRYRGADSGSYDWTWLLTSTGKTLQLAVKDTAPDIDPLIGWRHAHIPATASGSTPTPVCSPGNIDG